ncbi:hypothetical protein B0H15DRAFT_657952 [Mycena belliarum]|uniref:Uncharacterized protein n=1 Tax=Mycena belliarum TaxID=1033014 RepID=A0AAD6TTZ2_9AGAR|nr:hypothetical protein B0H15DRAFT_657952 [Mycena belliae]
MDRTGDPWAILLSKLAGINSPPKARQAYQQYMHESYDTEIAPAVQAQWAAAGGLEDDGLTLRVTKSPDAPFRAKVARDLFNALSKEAQEGLRTRARADAKVARDAYMSARKGRPSQSPEDKQRCIDHLGTFMSHILRGIEAYTGLHAVVVFGGPIPQRNGELKTVHFTQGRNRDPNPVTFPEWSKERFDKDVLEFMEEFLQTAFTPEECAAAALPNTQGSQAQTSQTDYDAFDFDSDSDSESGWGSTSESLGSEDSDSESERHSRRRKSVKGKGKAKEVQKKRASKDKTSKRKGKGEKRKRGEEEGRSANKRARGEGSSRLSPPTPIEPVPRDAMMLQGIDETLRLFRPVIWEDIEAERQK